MVSALVIGKLRLPLVLSIIFYFASLGGTFIYGLYGALLLPRLADNTADLAYFTPFMWVAIATGVVLGLRLVVWLGGVIGREFILAYQPKVQKTGKEF